MYEHYSNQHEDPEKRGQIIYANGKPLKRSKRSNPGCESCGKKDCLTVENEVLFSRYQLFEMGLDFEIEPDEPAYFLIIRNIINQLRKEQEMQNYVKMIGRV